MSETAVTDRLGKRMIQVTFSPDALLMGKKQGTQDTEAKLNEALVRECPKCKDCKRLSVLQIVDDRHVNVVLRATCENTRPSFLSLPSFLSCPDGFYGEFRAYDLYQTGGPTTNPSTFMPRDPQAYMLEDMQKLHPSAVSGKSADFIILDDPYATDEPLTITPDLKPHKYEGAW